MVAVGGWMVIEVDWCWWLVGVGGWRWLIVVNGWCVMADGCCWWLDGA